VALIAATNATQKPTGGRVRTGTRRVGHITAKASNGRALAALRDRDV
jgi:hypothetical protein